MTRLDYAYLLGLSALWGSSYLFIKIGVDGHLTPPELVFGRLLIATTVLYAVARLRGLRMPRDRAVWRSFAIMGLVGTAAPFTLISWGEQSIEAATTAAEDAPLLGIRSDGVVLVMARRSFAEDVQVEYATSAYRADRYQLLVPLAQAARPIVRNL